MSSPPWCVMPAGLAAAEGAETFRVQAKLAVLEKQFHRAEAILLQNDEVEEAMAMY